MSIKKKLSKNSLVLKEQIVNFEELNRKKILMFLSSMQYTNPIELRNEKRATHFYKCFFYLKVKIDYIYNFHFL